MHEIEEVNVIWVLAEVFTNHLEDRPFQKEGVIDSHKTNALHAVPARLPTTGDARVHNVV
jgi:hypothetical protein